MSTRILIVDDQPSITRACARVLGRAGYHVTQQNSSPNALALLDEETFDLLLTDIRMPEIDGMTLLTAAKQRDPHLSVVVITGFGTMDDTLKAMRLGAQGFLLKPYDPDDLLAVVQENLHRRALIRDSVRLQTLLPLLKLNDALQAGTGTASIAQQALQVAAKEIVPGRLQLWLKSADDTLKLAIDIQEADAISFSFSTLDLIQVIDRKQTLIKTKQGDCIWNQLDSQQILTICLPLISDERGLGVLVTGVLPSAPPLSNFQLELLQVLSGQLAVLVENIALFNRAKALTAFNQNILENMSTGLIALNDAGDITVLNKAAAMLLGLQNETLLGQHIAQALAHFPELAETIMTPLNDASFVQRGLVLQASDGTHLTVTATVSALYDTDEQRLTGVVSLIEDLTELKALEEESRRLDRLAALGEMSAVVAHELRNPIAGIAAGVNYLTKKLDLQATEYQSSQMILREVKRIHRIIEDIMLVARPLTLQKSLCSLHTIIENICERHQVALIKAKIQVRREISDTLPQLNIDEGRIEQVFDNLVSNAISAMATGGEITISAELIAAEVPQMLIIRFSDTGPGITKADQQKIFEPFYTTKSRGVGLGLALSRRILDAHAGDITIFETDGIGAVFEIKLPV